MFINSLNVGKNRIFNCLNPSKDTANLLSQVTIYPPIPQYMCVTPQYTYMHVHIRILSSLAALKKSIVL